MKRSLNTLAIACAALVGSAEARIDETLAECETRYGPIVERVKAKLSGSDPEACIFTKAGLSIIAEFKGGKAWSIAYRLPNLDEAAIQTLLTAEGTAAGWSTPVTIPGQIVRQSLDRKRVATLYAGKRVDDPVIFMVSSRDYITGNRADYEKELKSVTETLKSRQTKKAINDL